MPVGYVYDPVFLQHDTGDHPENASRLTHILSHLRQTDILPRLTRIAAEPVGRGDLLRVHDAALIERVREACDQGGYLTLDTPCSAGSYAAALQAAGSAVAATRAVLAGEVSQAFALVRPPGHHATRHEAMGFCLFNNVAVAAAWALAEGGLGRAAIVDFDLHHGNGTVDAFVDDDRVLYISTHQHPHYPNTGDWRYTGTKRSAGLCINIALPADSGDWAFRQACDMIIAPALRRFRPHFIFASAGYDTHWLDPYGNLLLSVDGCRRLVDNLMALAEELCGGRLALVLEGGYHLSALAHGVATTFCALLKRPYADPLGPAPGPECQVSDRLRAIARLHGLT